MPAYHETRSLSSPTAAPGTESHTRLINLDETHRSYKNLVEISVFLNISSRDLIYSVMNLDETYI